jgi:geranylgeranyl diphosphate synthase, type I
MDMEKLLALRSKRIDSIIEKYIPRSYNKQNLDFTLGPAKYSHDPRPANETIAKPFWELLDRGGKRWRPALFSIICEALGGDIGKYEDLVVLFEVVHNGSLVADDVEDSSEFRRGKPCIHKLFGVDVAVNIGSAMYYLPLLVLLKNDFPKDMKLKIYETYSQELINIHFGQAMDIAWHRGLADANDITEKEYLQMCAYKTGTLARLAAKVGAIAAGADGKTVEKMGALAEAIGIGFQIQDDILNLMAISGKNQFTKEYIGSDISEGKRTLIVIHALGKASSTDKKRLIEILNSHTTDKKKINEAIEILKKYNSLEYAQQFASSLVTDAWKDAKDLLKDNNAKKELEAFVKFAVERDH